MRIVLAATLALCITAPSASAGGFGDRVMSGITNAVMERTSLRTDGFERRRSIDTGAWAAAIVDRYGERLVSRCMQFQDCRTRMTDIVRRGDLHEMDRLFAAVAR